MNSKSIHFELFGPNGISSLWKICHKYMIKSLAARSSVHLNISCWKKTQQNIIMSFLLFGIQRMIWKNSNYFWLRIWYYTTNMHPKQAKRWFISMIERRKMKMNWNNAHSTHTHTHVRNPSQQYDHAAQCKWNVFGFVCILLNEWKIAPEPTLNENTKESDNFSWERYSNCSKNRIQIKCFISFVNCEDHLFWWCLVGFFLFFVGFHLKTRFAKNTTEPQWDTFLIVAFENAQLVSPV